MASVSITQELHSSRDAGSPLLVSLPSLSAESFEGVVRSLGEAFRGTEIVVASPDAEAREGSFGAVRLLSLYPGERVGDYVDADGGGLPECF